MDSKLPFRPKPAPSGGATSSRMISDDPEAYTLPKPDYGDIQLSLKNIRVDKSVYIPLYGLFTGDIWHVAAAQILSEYEKDGSDMPFGRFQIITCISVNNYDRRLAADEEVAKDSERPATAPQPAKRPISKSGQKRKEKARLAREEKARKKAEEAERKEEEKEAKRKRPRRKSKPRKKEKKKKQENEEDEEEQGVEADDDSSGNERRPRTKKPPPPVKETKKRGKEKEEKAPAGKKPKPQDLDDADDAPPPQWRVENAVVKRARGSWRYLTTIGLTTAVVLVRDGTGPLFWPYVHDYLTWDEVHEAYRRQSRGMVPRTFDDMVVGEIEAMGGNPPALDYRVKHGPTREPQLVDLLCSTSAAMQLMQYLGVRQSQMILGYRLSGGPQRTRWVEEVATQKLQQLVEKIDQVYRAVDNLGGVLLFNYRLGDVNKQHDSNVDILAQVRRLAAEQKLATIIVPQMDSKGYGELVTKLEADEEENENNENAYLRKYFHFDFLGLTVPDAPWMDNRVKAYFWHLVAVFLQRGSPLQVDEDPPSFVTPEHRCVHGFIGGRSGSTDLPAFVGLRCFSWEEPLLTAINTTLPQRGGNWNRKLYSFQGPQMLRLLNERSMMVTGFLNPDNMIYTKKKTGSDRIFKAIQERDNILQTWLKEPSHDADANANVPVLPRGVRATFAVSLVSFLPRNADYIIPWRESVVTDPSASSLGMRALY